MHAAWEGKACPKCAYVRLPTDANPAWQCPRCHIAYAKYRPRVAPLAARLAEDGREMAAEAKADGSLLSLLVANVLALGIAYYNGMGLRDLMFVYWIQSVVIGVTTFFRILNLDRFDPAGFILPTGPLEETASDKHKVALIFLLHYGFFHYGFLAYIMHEARGELGTPDAYFLCALVFAISHGYSLIRNLRRDAAGQPRISTLMSLPYARVVPMHATIMVGYHLAGPTGMFFVFAALKIVADLVMHVVEHHVLHKGR